MSNPVDRVLVEGRNIDVGEEALLLSRDGGEYSIADSAAPIRSREGDVVGAVLVFHDVTSERRIAQELRFQAAHDALTGLINRREFEVRVEQALGRARVDGAEHALCYIDLDQFKVVNDSCGHAAGDDLLRQVADLLRAQLRQNDTLARLGGDEFGLLLENCSKEMAGRITGKVLLAVHECRFRWRDQVFRLGASIGVAILSDPHQTLAQAFSAADSACYAAKEMGRNRVHFFRSGDEALARRIGEMGWVSRIHGALEEDRFVLFAQPVLALKRSGRSRRTYCEVLTRLREPDGTLTEPGAFIPAAERYGLMPRIDQWVVRRVLEQLADARVQADATVTYGINLSALSLTQEGMLDWFKALLRAHSLAPHNLCLEITETAAISNLALAQQFIAELKLLGCAFALDDFGSGMSSFTHLRHLGVDYLKIDGSFVVGAVNEPVDRAMIDAINRVGHTMGIQTIAECVESEAALAMLRELDVDYAQGFVVAHPRPLEEAVLGGVRAIAPVASGRRDRQVY